MVLVAAEGLLIAFNTASVPHNQPVDWWNELVHFAAINGVGAWVLTAVVYLSRFALTKSSTSRFYWLRVLVFGLVLLSCFYVGWLIVDWKAIPSWWFEGLPPNPRPVGRAIGNILILLAEGLSFAFPELTISLGIILILAIVISTLMLVDLIFRSYAVRLIYHVPQILENKKSLLTAAAILLGFAFHDDWAALRKSILGW